MYLPRAPALSQDVPQATRVAPRRVIVLIGEAPFFSGGALSRDCPIAVAGWVLENNMRHLLCFVSRYRVLKDC